MSALEILYGGQFTLSTQLINQISLKAVLPFFVSMCLWSSQGIYLITTSCNKVMFALNDSYTKEMQEKVVHLQPNCTPDGNLQVQALVGSLCSVLWQDTVLTVPRSIRECKWPGYGANCLGSVTKSWGVTLRRNGIPCKG